MSDLNIERAALPDDGDQKLHDLIQEAVMFTTTIPLKKGDTASAITVGTIAANAALHLTAAIAGRATPEQIARVKAGENVTWTEKVSKEGILFAALLCYHTCHNLTAGGNVCFEMSPRVITRALNDAAKILGYSIDDKLTEGLAEESRRLATDESDNERMDEAKRLEVMLQEMKPMMGSSKYIN